MPQDSYTTPPELDRALPLVVDLDGTLLKTDLLFECLAVLARRRPWLLCLVPLWAWRGRAFLKRRLAELAPPSVATLPVDAGFVAWLTQLATRGHRLYLYSAADESLARAVAARFGLFAGVRGSDGRVNCAGAVKLAAIRDRFGDTFAYAGNGRDDLVILRAARAAVLVGPTDWLAARLRTTSAPAGGAEGGATPVVAVFPAPPAGLRLWARALRLHHWAKNALLGVPLLLSPRLGEPEALAALGVGFLGFGLLTSTTYLVNDLLDLDDDRRHRSKAARPLASGTLPLWQAFVALPALTLTVAALLAIGPPGFAGIGLGYAVLTILYSFWLKRIASVDLLVLAVLFTLRVAAGLVLIRDPLSPWLLSFSLVLFFSLAAVKRYGEWRLLADGTGDTILRRGYQLADGVWLLAMGVAASFSSIVVLLVYLIDRHYPGGVYRQPEWLWIGALILLYWLGRCWLLAVRGQMQDDPLLFALRDRVSLGLGGAAIALLAWVR